MQTKRDQLQAHSFVVGRLRSALLRGEADALETPTRRFSVAAFAGLLIGALLVAACGVLGFVFPGSNSSWRQAGSLIVEKETGSRYVYLDGTLHPVLNLASARLLLGPQAVVRSVSMRSLEGVPHGPAVGIAGAPDALPAVSMLTTSDWLVCATTNTDPTGQHDAGVSVLIGRSQLGTPVPPEASVSVRTTDGSTYLVWHGRRFRAADRTALVALGHSGARSQEVAPEWLNALPQGPDLRSPAISRRGEPGPLVDGRATTIGQVLTVERQVGGSDFYAVVADGLAPIAPVTASMLLADPDSRAAYGQAAVQPIKIATTAVVAAPHSTVSLDPDGLPATPPEPFDALASEMTLCARHTVQAESLVSLVLVESNAATTGVRHHGRSDSAMVADEVLVGPGMGVLARARPAPDVTGQTLYLVTDVGVKYPLASADAAAALGYQGVPAADVAAGLLAFLPSGPALDPADAGTVHPGLVVVDPL